MSTLTAAEANALHHDNPLRGMAWLDATQALRKEIFAEAYEEAKAEIIKERESKVLKQSVWTPSQHEKAQRIAKGTVVQEIWKLKEYNGYRNPGHEDPEWAPKPQVQEADYKANRYGGKCPKCGVWVEAEAGKLVKLPDGKWGAEHLTCPEAPKVEAPAQGLDLTNLPSGYYAVPGGDTRLKVRISHGKEGSKWDGYTFVTDGAEYGAQKRYGMQRPGQAYKGDIMEQLEAIVAQPLEAMKTYGHLVERCGRCNALLEDEESVANGIGPICAGKF